MPAKVFPGVRIQAAVSGVYTTCSTACVGVQVRGFSLGSSFPGPASLTSAIRLDCWTNRNAPASRIQHSGFVYVERVAIGTVTQ